MRREVVDEMESVVSLRRPIKITGYAVTEVREDSDGEAVSLVLEGDDTSYIDCVVALQSVDPTAIARFGVPAHQPVLVCEMSHYPSRGAFYLNPPQRGMPLSAG
jgi:hypothetical protein